jgi:hypothetical protein
MRRDGPCVLYPDDDILAVALQDDRDPRTRVRVNERIVHEVSEGPPQPDFVPPDARIALRLKVHPAALLVELFDEASR